MTILAPSRLFGDLYRVSFELLEPVRFSADQRRILEIGNHDRLDPEFIQFCRGLTIARFKDCAAEDIMRWVRKQDRLHSNESVQMLGDDDNVGFVNYPPELDRFGAQFRGEVSVIVSHLFPGTYARKDVCEAGLITDARTPRLHVDLTVACTARLGGLPLMILNPENREAAEARIREMHGTLDDKQKEAAKKGIWLLTEAMTAQLRDEGHLVAAPLGEVCLNLIGTTREFEDRLTNGFPHASSEVKEPTHSAFLFTRLYDFYKTPALA